MLEMINVSYAYKSKKEIVHVLDKVTYRFEIGEMYGIFGPSGSGKTTCLSLLAGLEKPDEGKFCWMEKIYKILVEENCAKIVYHWFFRIISYLII